MDSGSGFKSEREKGKAFSVHFYTKTIFKKAEEFNKEFPLHPYFLPLIGDKKEVSIADLGAGMFSTTGSFLKGVKINLYPSDELAEEYDESLKKFGIVPVIPVKKENMEKLSYPDNFFDIVHCTNALDHCENPDLAIKEMYRVCKKGGWIYLRHFLNTGEMQKYRGMHHWNISIIQSGDCLFWGKERNFLLSSLFIGFNHKIKKEMDYERYKMLVTTFQK
jgi:ubiquinone/menaquinone biosynthesis C-methylase UbiE